MRIQKSTLVKAVAAAIAALVVVAPIFGATSYSVSLNLQGGVGNRQLTSCGIRHHYTLYRRAQRISFDGYVRPAPKHAFRVKVKVKKCRNGQFRTVLAIHVRGSASTGHYRGHLPLTGLGYFFARSYFYGIPPQSRAVARSTKQFFRVTKTG